MRHIIISVDPGRCKFGIAVMSVGGLEGTRVYERYIVKAENITQLLIELRCKWLTDVLVTGNQTGRGSLVTLGMELGFNVKQVNEHMSTQLARMRYLNEHPPRGLARLVPRGLRWPSEAFDDYAAVIIGERYHESLGDSSK